MSVSHADDLNPALAVPGTSYGGFDNGDTVANIGFLLMALIVISPLIVKVIW
jgi:hypothetical protein